MSEEREILLNHRSSSRLSLLVPLAVIAISASPAALAGPQPPLPEEAAASGEHPATADYVGSEICQACHADLVSRWAEDWHSRALASAGPGSVVGDFNGAHFKGLSSEAWMRREDSLYVVRTRDQDGVIHDYQVQWVLGGKRMQDPVTVLDDGRWQVLPVYYHVTAHEWVDFTEARQGPVGPSHPFFWTNFRRTANRECMDCHTTGLEVSYASDTHRFTTHFVEPGVACESCHGPGRRHSATADPKEIVNPGRIGATLGLAVCASCHGQREPIFPLLDAAHHFQPGQRYEDRYQVLAVTDGPLISPDFFTDGRPRSSSLEYQAILQSRCHLKGEATCLSCHTSPHEPHADNNLVIGAARSAPDIGSATCAGCHSRIVADAPRHSHHHATAAQTCLACHMPKMVPGVLDLFADHSLDVPVPENTIRHGVPNACNLCHVKETPESMADAMHKWWPGAAAREERRLRLADAFDPATALQSREPLAAVVSDKREAPSLRAAAATLLAVRFPAGAVEKLAPLLGDPNGLVRAGAVHALGFLPAREALPAARAVEPLLADSLLQVRQSAAILLAFLDLPVGEEALRVLSTDHDTEGLVQPHFKLGYRAAQRGDLEIAEAEFKKVLSLQFYNTFALVALADLYVMEGRKDLATAELKEALRFDPENEAVKKRLESIGRF